MKIGNLYVVLVVLGLFFLTGCNQTAKEKETLIEEKVESVTAEIKELRHVVLFKFKENTSADSIAIIEKEFSALPSKIKEIRDFEWGTNNSPEGIAKGFTHSFLVTFHSEKDREIYLPHPDHENFVKIVGPLVEDVLVLDYWAGK